MGGSFCLSCESLLNLWFRGDFSLSFNLPNLIDTFVSVVGKAVQIHSAGTDAILLSHSGHPSTQRQQAVCYYPRADVPA